MDRGEALRTVADMITKDRNNTHGEAVDQLTHAQMLKNAIGHHSSPYLTHAEIEAIDMIAVKLSRLAKGKPILDHYMDIAGYAGIAVEARSAADVVILKRTQDNVDDSIPGKIPVKVIGEK